MALTRSFLRSLSLSEDQIAAIIEAHTETVSGIRKETADEQDSLTKQVEALKKDLETAKKSETKWESKFNESNKAFEEFKTEQAQKATRSAKENAYKTLLKESGVSDKRFETILKVTDLDKISLTEDGAIENAKEVTDTIKHEWADFIEKKSIAGANVPNPPSNSGGTMTRDEIMAITDRVARREAIKNNPAAFGK